MNVDVDDEIFFLKYMHIQNERKEKKGAHARVE